MIAKVGFAKAAEALTADGWLAVLGNVPVGLSEGLLEPFKEIYLRHTGAWLIEAFDVEPGAAAVVIELFEADPQTALGLPWALRVSAPVNCADDEKQ